MPILDLIAHLEPGSRMDEDYFVVIWLKYRLYLYMFEVGSTPPLPFLIIFIYFQYPWRQPL